MESRLPSCTRLQPLERPSCSQLRSSRTARFLHQRHQRTRRWQVRKQFQSFSFCSWIFSQTIKSLTSKKIAWKIHQIHNIDWIHFADTQLAWTQPLVQTTHTVTPALTVHTMCHRSLHCQDTHPDNIQLASTPQTAQTTHTVPKFTVFSGPEHFCVQN